MQSELGTTFSDKLILQEIDRNNRFVEKLDASISLLTTAVNDGRVETLKSINDASISIKSYVDEKVENVNADDQKLDDRVTSLENKTNRIYGIAFGVGMTAGVAAWIIEAGLTHIFK